MNCGTVRNLLSAFIDCELTGSQMLAIRSHLTICNECQKEVAELKAVKSALSLLADQIPDETFSERIVAHAVAANRPQVYNRSGVLALATAAAAAAVLAIVVFNASSRQVDRSKLAKDPAGFDSQTDQAVTMPDFGGHAPLIPVSK